MMSWRFSLCLILIPCSCLLIGCDENRRNRLPQAETSPVESPAVASSAPESEGDPATEARDAAASQSAPGREDVGDLSLKIALDETVDNPQIDFSEPFDVVLTNHSDQPLRLWNPQTKRGYYQLSFTFVNSRTGKTYTARKRTIDIEEFGETKISDEEEDADFIRIASQDRFKIHVNFNEIWGERVWLGLPGPVSSDRFSVTAQVESQDDAGEHNHGIWTGTALSDPVVVQLFDPRIITPLDCLWNGYAEAAIEMMEADPDSINRRGDDQCTPLHHAARFGHVDAVRWLLDHGADANAVAYNGFTPLHMTESTEVVRLILQKQPDLTILSLGQTPLQNAAEELSQARGETERQQWTEIIKLFVDAGVKIDLLTAIHLNDLERVKTILKKSPELADDFQDESLLRTAASLGRLEICRYLIENYRVDVNDFERGSGYPIIKGALAHPDVVQLLIEHGADLKTRITWRAGRTGIWIIGDDATLLHHAADDGVPQTVRLLIDNGVDIFATDRHLAEKDRQQTALEIAAFFGKADNAEAIINHPSFEAADPALRQTLLDKSLLMGAAPTWLARDANRVKLVRVLLEKGADPNAGQDGVTALQAAAGEIHPTHKKENAEIKEIVGLLTSHGATMDLVSAVALGNTSEVQRLLANDPKSANSRRADGFPALHIAVGMNDRAIVEALLNAGVDVDIRNQCKSTGSLEETPLHCAAFWGRLELASLLIEAGSDVNALTDRKSTPLHNAARMGHVKLAEMLLEHGANPDAKDNENETPLDWGGKDDSEMENLFRDYRTRSGK